MTKRRILDVCAIATVIALSAASANAQTTTSRLTGVVKYVEGNTLVVTMSNGSPRTFTVAEDRKFMIDGKELTVHDLKPGTSLTATITTTTTNVMQRTVTNLTGKVWYVMGNTVILTLPDGQNKMYQSQPHFQFTVNGQKTDVSALRKGMEITAEKVVEQPVTEVANNTVVTGHSPKSSPIASRMPQ